MVSSAGLQITGMHDPGEEPGEVLFGPVIAATVTSGHRLAFWEARLTGSAWVSSPSLKPVAIGAVRGD